MNQLNKLIEQYEKESGEKAFTRNYNKYGNEQPPTYKNEFVKWQANEIEKLASRTTCGEEQRKFLDELEKKFEYMGDTENAFELKDGHSILDGYDFGKIDLQKVIRGE